MRKTKARLKNPVSAALRELRQRAGLSQEGLARMLRVAVQTCVLWETKRPPTGVILLRLSDLAAHYHFDDLKEVFEKAIASLPPAIVADIRKEREMWEAVESRVDGLEHFAPGSSEYQREIAEIGELISEIKERSWRNQR
jgi:transcriptional regulator with XRE-family HTH domain